MALTSGTKLGPYEILVPIGAGGMGEVYRARDQRLGRDVAVKALPDAFAKDPDRIEIIAELIETAIEELGHFQQVYAHMARRGLRLAKEMSEDPYIKTLLELCRTDPVNRFLDRLLLASIIECRGAERFRLVWETLEQDAELKEFYHQLWVSEAKHGNSFVKMALNYFEQDRVDSRLRELNEAEGKIIQSLELRAALH